MKFVYVHMVLARPGLYYLLTWGSINVDFAYVHKQNP